MLWHDILERADKTNKALQNPKLHLNIMVASMKSLKEFVMSKRECFEEYERKGAEKAGTHKYLLARSRIKSELLTPVECGHAPSTQMSPSRKFCVESFLPVIDQYASALNRRMGAYDHISSLFGFLSRLVELDSGSVRSAGDKLAAHYKNDLDSSSFGNELVQFKEFVRVFLGKEQLDVSMENFMYTLIREKGVQDEFPNVEIALRIYLVLMITNCSAERSFSKMKLIKNRLRTSMLQERFTNLALLSIESDILREINFDDIINDFANRKARKAHL
jgi:hypothetical protein